LGATIGSTAVRLIVRRRMPAQPGLAFSVAQQHQLAAACSYLLEVGGRLVEDGVGRRHHHNRDVFIDQRNRPVLHLAAGIAFGVDVGNFLQLERAFERDRKGQAAAEIEDVARRSQNVLGDAPV